MLNLEDKCSSDSDDADQWEHQKNKDLCYRCQKRVYPVERVDVGALFHRRCFRCRICGLQLTLRTFHWEQEQKPDVYCQVHVTKFAASIDKDCVGIRTALTAPKRGINANEQIRGSTYNPGWQYDAQALEFTHHRDLILQKKPKLSLGSYKDFEESGVFDAQSELERRHKEEEDNLYKQFLTERTKQVQRLDEELKVEQDKSVKDLVSAFEKITTTKDKEGVDKQKEKLEAHYRRKKDERLRNLLEKLSSEEKLRVARLIEKHSQQMLLLIAEKLTLTETSSSDSDSSSRPPSLTLSHVPPAAPPEFRRSQLFKSPEEFDVIDSNVCKVAQTDYSLFTDLVKDLIKHCQTDLEKARALFRWITGSDLNKMDIDSEVNPESPMGLLRGIKYGTESYHDLFKRLCSYAGLYCEVVQGYSKGAGYKPGMRITGERFRNSWTAVFIEGSWCFVNCNWGARHVKGKESGGDPSSTNTFFYRCDEFYFITDPEDHIYQHLPDDPKWQLLECPITLSEFINLPVVKSPFFNYGIKFANHYDCTQYSNNGVVILQFNIPNLLGFGHTLEWSNSNMDASKLEGRVMLRIIGHKAIFTVVPPKAGKFYFTIFAKDDWNSHSLQSACSFRIKCRERREHIKTAYPNIPFFGPTPNMAKHGVVPQTHLDPLVSYSHDDIIIQFQLHNEVQLSHGFQYYGQNCKEINDFQRFAFVKSRDEKTVSYQIRCPSVGKYVFSIFSSQMMGSTYGNLESNCLFRYIIDCKQPAKDKRPLPRACHRWYKCTLLEPFVGDIEREQTITFRVRAPLADDVALLAGDVWFHFRELADSIWEGAAFTGSVKCKAKLYAKLSKDKARFSPLVEFQIT